VALEVEFIRDEVEMAQGRGHAKAILRMVALLAFSHAVAAKDLVVGGSTQEWNFPPGTDTGFYDTWSNGIKFAVGDNLRKPLYPRTPSLPGPTGSNSQSVTI
jgi:hypothetical protein